MTPTITKGCFIRVRADHSDGSRAGKDAMVMSVDGDDVGLYFGLDRRNQPQALFTAGAEAWKLEELDLASAEH